MMQPIPYWDSLESLRSLYATKEPGYEDAPWRALSLIEVAYEMELETCELIYSMVRLLKPSLVLESGSGYGAGSAWIGYALKENGYGRLIAYESSSEWLERGKERLNNLDLPVELRLGTISDYCGDMPKIVVIDSEPTYRRQEIARWRNQKDVILIVHDANRNYDLPRGVIFDSYRGLYIGMGE